MILTWCFYVLLVLPLTAVIFLIEEPSELLTVVGAAHQLASAPGVRPSELHPRPLPKGWKWRKLLLACWPKCLTYRHCNLHPLRRKDSPACNTAPPSACCRHTGGLLVTGNTIVERCNLPWSANPTVIVTWQWLQRDGFIIVPRQLWRWRDRRQRGTSDTWGW